MLFRLLFEILPNCLHTVVVEGLCATCGIELKDQQINHVVLGTSSDVNISVTRSYAETLSQHRVSKLLKRKRLILVLDLDNTLLHASEQRPPPDMLFPDTLESLSNFQKEEERLKSMPIDSPFLQVAVIDGRNMASEMMYRDDITGELHFPHYRKEAEIDPLTSSKIRCLEHNLFYLQTPVFFHSPISNSPVARGLSNSHFKLRRGVIKFLRELSEQYELIMFTAGTQEHADSALQLIDPERKFFEDRVFARTAVGRDGVKSLSQILPTDHEMMVVIDDTTRVWAEDVGLFMCHPYMWHVDLYNHFLGPFPSAEALIKARSIRNSVCQYSPKLIRAIYRLLKSSERVMKARAAVQMAKLSEHVAGDLSSITSPEVSETPVDDELLTYVEETEVETGDFWRDLERTWDLLKVEQKMAKKIPSAIFDNDLQLYNLISILKSIHQIFFRTIEAQDHQEAIAMPSCREIIAFLRSQVLQGCKLCFLGDPLIFDKSDMCKLARASGAEILYNSEVTSPTHYLVDPPAKIPSNLTIPTVSIQWLEFAVCTLM